MTTNTLISEEIKQQVITLYKSGKSLQKVANKLNIHKSSVHRILTKENITRTMSQGSKLRPKWSEEHKQKISQKLKGRSNTWSMKRINSNYQEITPALAYIVGVSMFDASISHSFIKLESKDKEFVEEFQKQLKIHFGRCTGVRDGKKAGIFPSYRGYKEYKRSATFVVSLNSVIASKFVDSCRNYEWVESLSIENKIHWLRGAWDSEGTVAKYDYHPYPTLRFVNKKKWKINLYLDILYDITEDRYSLTLNKQGMYAVYTYNKEWILKFYKIINPTIQRKKDIFELLR